MSFWGVEVKPGKPYTHVHDWDLGKLLITQATLGDGTSTKRSIVQCNVGSKSPVMICSLLPDKSECCSLKLEFEEEDEVVLSVVGPRSVHLSGYYLGPGRCNDGDSTDSYGEDIAKSETDDSVSFDSDDEYEEDFIDDEDDYEMFPPSPKPKSGVVIEEIIEEPANCARNRYSRKHTQVIDSDNDIVDSECQLVVRRSQQCLESEDEDGFPISTSTEKSNVTSTEGNKKSEKMLEKIKEGKDNAAPVSGSESVQKSSVLPTKVVTKGKKKKEQDQGSVDREKKLSDMDKVNESQTGDSSKKMKKKKKRKDEIVESDEHASAEKSIEKAATDVGSNKALEDGEKVTKKNKKRRTKADSHQDGKTQNAIPEGDRNLSNGNPEKKLKKTKSSLNESAPDKMSNGIKAVEETKKAPESVNDSKEQNDNYQTSQTRTFPNGLTIDELAMGKPDGKRASDGKKVSVHYIGKLRNGKIFDSNIGTRPFQFRLGVGQVIKGWDVGVNGMRVGDKRRLTIPPSMGYGSKNMGKIPANSWLTFDVELVAVK